MSGMLLLEAGRDESNVEKWLFLKMKVVLLMEKWGGLMAQVALRPSEAGHGGMNP